MSGYFLALNAAHYELFYYAQCGSTNESALQSPVKQAWFVTDEQTAGRGRMGREWVSPKGNLACSVKITRHFNVPLLSQISLVAGVALREALRDLDIASLITLKWPNDLMLNGKKIAGILVEASTMGHMTTIVVGFGVNLGAIPDINRAVETLQGKITAESLFLRLTDRFESAMMLWDNGAGFDAIRNRFKQAAEGLGKTLTFMQNDQEVTGKFKDISLRGGLMLETYMGLTEIMAGEIVRFHGNT